MKTKLEQSIGKRRREAGFSLLDVGLAIGLASIMFVSLWSGMISGFSIVRMGRENTRATQIMMEKMETIRLYTWEQINSNGFVPTNFIAQYYPAGSTNAGGVSFTGRLTIAESGINTDYGTNVRLVTVDLDWLTGKLPRRRSLSTYVSRNGLQSYIY